MPGLSRSSQYQFSTATLMIAPMSVNAGINSAAHSVGLVKKVDFQLTTNFVDLTQGIENQVVASMVNKQDARAQCEIYELTARNLAYGLGLDATSTSFAPQTIVSPVASAVAAAATSVQVATDMSADFVAGTWAFLQEGLDDSIYIFKVASSAYAAPNTTITMAAGYAVPAGMSFDTAAGRVGLLTKTDNNPSLANQTFAVRIAGITAMDKRPVVIHMPKAKIVKGFGVNFDSANWGNLPFEIEAYVPSTTDVGYNSDFSQLFTILTP